MTKIILVVIAAVIANANCCQRFDCKRSGDFVNPDDKHSYVQCANGEAYLRRCPKSGDDLSYQIFDGHKCCEPFDCPKLSGKYRHDYNERLYYQCTNGVAHVRHCPHGYMYDGRDVCIELFECPKLSGFFAHPRNRTLYYECCYGKPSLMVCTYDQYYEERTQTCRCPEDYRYDERTKRCEAPVPTCADGYTYEKSLGRCEIIACPLNHRYDSKRKSCVTVFPVHCPETPVPNPLNNSQYCECRKNEWTCMSCPCHTVFDQKQHKCVSNAIYRCHKSVCVNHPDYKDYCSCSQKHCMRIYDGERCVRPYRCPKDYGLYKHLRHPYLYYECEKGWPALKRCSPGFVYDERHLCCVSDPWHYKTNPKVVDRRESIQNGMRIIDNWDDKNQQWIRSYQSLTSGAVILPAPYMMADQGGDGGTDGGTGADTESPSTIDAEIKQFEDVVGRYEEEEEEEYDENEDEDQ